MGQNKNSRMVSIDGMMTFGVLDNGLRIVDFESYEHLNVEPTVNHFKVQIMRGGNVYMTEKPKRVKNKPIFRQDNSSLSLGKNGMYYFVFTLPEEEVADLPTKLVRQANEVAAKISGMFYRSSRV